MTPPIQRVTNECIDPVRLHSAIRHITQQRQPKERELCSRARPMRCINAALFMLWLTFILHVPDAHIVLVASHYKTNITDAVSMELFSRVQRAASDKINELNEITRLEVDQLRTLFDEAQPLLLRRLQRASGDVAWEQDSSTSCVACPCDRRFNVLHRRHHFRCAQLHRRDTHAAV
jgi:hypothetical protein